MLCTIVDTKTNKILVTQKAIDCPVSFYEYVLYTLLNPENGITLFLICVKSVTAKFIS